MTIITFLTNWRGARGFLLPTGSSASFRGSLGAVCFEALAVLLAVVTKGGAYLFSPPRRVQWWGSLGAEQPLPASSLNRNSRNSRGGGGGVRLLCCLLCSACFAARCCECRAVCFVALALLLAVIV